MAFIYAIVIVWLGIQATVTPLICKGSCEEGQYCIDTECFPCKHGFYQSSPIHSYTSCFQWTTKPEDAHWVISRNGTSKNDVEWRCAEGYESSQFSVQEYECKEIITTSTVRSTTNPSTSSSTTFEQFLLYIGLFTVVLLGALVLTIFCVCRRRQRLKIKSKGNVIESGELQNLDPDSNRPTGDDSKSISSAPEEATADVRKNTKLPPGIDFKYFNRVVKHLSMDSHQFIHHLEDPSGNFHAKSSIEFKRSMFQDPEVYFTEACLDWARANPHIDHKEYVERALSSSELFLEKASEQCETRPPNSDQPVSPPLPREESMSPQVHATMKSCPQDVKDVSLDNTTKLDKNTKIGLKVFSTPLYVPTSRTPSKSLLYKLFSRIVGELGPDDCWKLLYRLPNESKIFNTLNYMKFKQHGMASTDIDICFIETLVEWKKRNPKIVNLQECFSELLTELNRNDVKDNQDIIDLMKQCDISLSG